MRLSVIIPGFKNPDAWWLRSVRSVLGSIGADDEVICVDDGSPTRPKALEALSRSDGRVRVLYKGNGGLSDARNAALEIAKGHYVSFVDSDDEVIPGVFEQCLDILESTQSDIALYGVEVRWVNEGLKKRDVPNRRCYGHLSPDDIHSLTKKCLLNYAWNKVYRKSFLDQYQIRFDVDGMPCEDIAFNLDCVCAGANWCSINAVGYIYYRVSGGRTILSSYKPSNHKGLAAGAAAWKRYCEMVPTADRVWFSTRASLSPQQLDELDWQNIWMPGSPYSLWARWKWLKEHPELGGACSYVKKAIFVFFRRHMYFRPVRRWHVRKMYPHVEEVK